MLRSSDLVRAFFLVSGLALLAAPLMAQNTGHYLQGATGLDNGSQAPPGFYFQYLPYEYFIDSLKGPRGNSLVNTNLTIIAHNLALSFVAPKKILGANYSATVIVPIVNQRLEGAAIPGSFGQYGLSDIYVSPLGLGWHLNRFDVLANYGFYAPSGSFDANKIANLGLGFWENQFQLGTTYHVSKAHAINVSMLTTWEINQKKQGLDSTPGSMFTLEYGLGKKFLKGGLNLGVSGSYYRKLTADSGTDLAPILVGLYDQSAQIGPEAQLTLPITKTGIFMSFLVRYQPQFAVESRTRGQVLVFGISAFKLILPH